MDFSVFNLSLVTRKSLVWKLFHGYSLCYCRTFFLVLDTTECTQKLLPKNTVHYAYYLKLNDIKAQRKTTNIEKSFIHD